MTKERQQTTSEMVSQTIEGWISGAYVRDGEVDAEPTDINRTLVTTARTDASSLRDRVADEHPNPVNVWNTNDEGRAALLAEYLDAIEAVCPNPRMLPLDAEGKAPAIEGKCRLRSQQAKEMLHTRDEAIAAIEDGASGFALYAGHAEHGTENLVFADHDDLSTFPLDNLPDTLTVVSGSGKGYHETFVNTGDVRNAKGTAEMEGAGEIRASNWYVVLPGSVHPSGGIYHLKEKRPIAELQATTIPDGLRPSTDSYSESGEIELSQETVDGEFTNELGMSLAEVREYDKDLNRLLETPPRPDSDTQDDSRIDAQLVRRLRYHHFEPRNIATIWRQYRSRPKLKRDDYVQMTIQKCGTHGERCRYEGSEQGVVLPEVSPTTEWDWRDASQDDVSTLTRSEAQRRCQSRIADALRNSEHTLIDALPAMGKSSGVVQEAAATETPITVFTSRHDLYEQYSNWCEDHGLSYHQLPSFHNDCPTASGENGDEWKDRVLSVNKQGVMASEIHKYGEQYFGKSLPCDEGQECPYKLKWDFEAEEYDVIIGHYTHAYNENVTSERTVVFDEFPEDAFLSEFESETVSSAVSTYLSENEGLPFEDYTGLIEQRDSKRGEEARKWFEGDDLERDGELVLTSGSSSANAFTPLLTYALLVGNDLGNGWEHAALDSEDGLGTHRHAARKRDSGTVHLLLPPKLDDATSVIALDGTPTPGLWKMTVDKRLSRTQILADEERATYLSDVLGHTIIQTTGNVNTYSSGTYVAPEEDGLLFEAVAEREEVKPALISTAKAIAQYEQESVLGPVGTCEHYGNMKGSNQFKYEHVGIVVGSCHYGDSYVKRWGALAGKCIQRDDGGKGMNLTYGEYGNKVLHHMREHEVLQAVLRFGRDDTGATVYVHTCALPDWVPVAAKGEVERWSKGIKEIIDVLEAEAPSEWTTSDIAAEVSISTRQVRTNLDKLAGTGYVEKQQRGRGYLWVVEDEEIDELGQVHFRSSEG